MGVIRVAHVTGDQFRADVRGHSVVIDQPVAEGGGDQGPTPTELFVIGLVACVAHYARGYLARHDLDATGLSVVGTWDFAGDRPSRVGHVSIQIDAPSTLPVERRAALLAVASHCTVHNTLADPPEITIVLADGRPDIVPKAELADVAKGSTHIDSTVFRADLDRAVDPHL